MKFYCHLLLCVLISSTLSFSKEFPNQSGELYQCLKWELQNFSFEGNPFDLLATVELTHPSGARHSTPMYYAGDNVWKFRFTGTSEGDWTFKTTSDDPELNGHTGTVTVTKPEQVSNGFLTNFDNKWGWSGSNEAFVPQLVMYHNPEYLFNNPDVIDDDIQTFFAEHGFNGFHVPVMCRWFDIEHESTNDIDSDNPNPDPRTFEILEQLITKTHAAGGMVHFWAWGDEQRGQTTDKWGQNETVDLRLQRYIAARLGPLPGWSMGYGFDLDEWATEDELKTWHEKMHSFMGWFHYLGGRSEGPNHGTDHEGFQIYEGLDYASYEHHRPTYEVYREALKINPNRPVFSEDRFRIRQPSHYPEKDYTEELTRRGLWLSTMAGGVANIWGNLINAQGDASVAYQNPHWSKTWSRFFESRFLKDMQPDSTLSSGYVLKSSKNNQWVIYEEDTDQITFDLSNMNLQQPVVAVDTKRPYREIKLGQWTSAKKEWKAPRRSDWAIAIGDF